MKRIFTLIIAAMVILPCLTSCLYEENIDCSVEWGFAEDTNSNISYGLESLLPSAQVIFDAFDKCFYSDYEKSISSHEAIMREQHSKSKALKNAKKTAEKAASMIDAGHTCPVDYIFVVRVKYGTETGYNTAWSHDYR